MTRTYKVYVKGNRAATERTIVAKDKGAAIWRYSLDWGVKSYTVDAVWIKESEGEKLRAKVVKHAAENRDNVLTSLLGQLDDATLERLAKILKQ